MILCSLKVKNVDGRFEPTHDVYICVWQSDGRKIDKDPKNVGCDEFDNDELDPDEKVWKNRLT